MQEDDRVRAPRSGAWDDAATAALTHWLALLHAPGLGSRGFNRLLEQFGSPRRLFEEPGLATPLDTAQCRLSAYLRNPDWRQVERDLLWMEQPGCHILTLEHPDYPPLLREIADRPPLLFVLGNPAHLALPQLAMVGSRNPTASGRRTARDFARHLAKAGLCMTSGLATGIDGACHEGALDVGGVTIAVTGTGLDRVYPARHRALAHRIAEQGAIVSELAPGTPPMAANFPRRNRIISGLSLGALVVEAAQKSGSLITARLASEQGREVFAIPGSIHNPLARGCHALIRQGAKLVESAQDIIEELGPLLGALIGPGQGAKESAPEPSQQPREWDAEYQQLFAHLSFDPTPIDTIIEQSGLTAEKVSSMLLLLELEGYVASAPGGRYQLTAQPSD